MPTTASPSITGTAPMRRSASSATAVAHAMLRGHRDDVAALAAEDRRDRHPIISFCRPARVAPSLAARPKTPPLRCKRKPIAPGRRGIEPRSPQDDRSYAARTGPKKRVPDDLARNPVILAIAQRRLDWRWSPRSRADDRDDGAASPPPRRDATSLAGAASVVAGAARRNVQRRRQDCGIELDRGFGDRLAPRATATGAVASCGCSSTGARLRSGILLDRQTILLCRRAILGRIAIARSLRSARLPRLSLRLSLSRPSRRLRAFAVRGLRCRASRCGCCDRRER